MTVVRQTFHQQIAPEQAALVAADAGRSPACWSCWARSSATPSRPSVTGAAAAVVAGDHPVGGPERRCLVRRRQPGPERLAGAPGRSRGRAPAHQRRPGAVPRRGRAHAPGVHHRRQRAQRLRHGPRSRSMPASRSRRGCWTSSTGRSSRASWATSCRTSATTTSGSRCWWACWSAASRCSRTCSCASPCSVAARRSRSRSDSGGGGGRR